MLCIVYQLCSRFFFYSPMNMCASSRWCGTHKLKKVVYVYSKCQTTTSFNSYFAISSTFERLGGSFAKIAQSHFFECISCRSLFLARNVADIYLYIADIYIYSIGFQLENVSEEKMNKSFLSWFLVLLYRRMFSYFATQIRLFSSSFMWLIRI